MEVEKEAAAKDSTAGLEQINAAKAENEMRAARALQADQKPMWPIVSKKAVGLESKLAALREQQKAVENEEQSALNNGKAMANDAKVSQIMQETGKNKLAQESTRRGT